MATKIPYDQGSGLLRVVRSDSSFDEAYCTSIELNIILQDSEVRVFEVKSFGYTILRVDQDLIVDLGAFTDYSSVQDAYDDVFNVLTAMLAGIGGGGSGDVTTSGTVLDEEIVIYDGTTGDSIKSSGYTIAQLLALIFDGAIEVNAATTANLAAFTYNNGAAGVGATITMNAVGAFPNQDGVAMNTVGRKLLVKNAANPAHRGTYEMTTAGTGGVAAVWTRMTNSDSAGELYPQVVIVAAGTVNKSKVFVQTNAALATIGTDAITYGTAPAPNLTGYIAQPISKTVAQMQALVGSFVPGQIYKITDNTFFPDGLYVTAYNTDELLPFGSGAFINAVMSNYVMAKAGYSLLTNTVNSIQVDHLQDGTPTNVYVVDHGNGGIALWPFDSTTINNFSAIDPFVGTVTGTIENVTLGDSVTIACDATSTIGNVVAGAGSSVQATDGGAAALIGNCTIGQNSIVNIVSWTLQNFTVGDGKQIDTTSLNAGGSINGGYYIGNVSTITLSDGNVSAGQLDMSTNGGEIDMTGFAYAGVLMVRSDGSTALDTMSILAMPIDHNVKICNDGSNPDLIINDKDVNSGNISLEISNSTITIDNVYVGLEFLELKSDGARILQQAASVRI